MPTFIGAIIVASVRALACIALVLFVAGCGGGKSAWPDCLRMTGARHVRVATAKDLRKSTGLFPATRAAAIRFIDGAQATVAVAATRSDAVELARNLRVPSASIVRHDTVVLRWLGPDDAQRERAIFECAAT